MRAMGDCLMCALEMINEKQCRMTLTLLLIFPAYCICAFTHRIRCELTRKLSSLFACDIITVYARYRTPRAENKAFILNVAWLITAAANIFGFGKLHYRSSQTKGNNIKTNFKTLINITCFLILTAYKTNEKSSLNHLNKYSNWWPWYCNIYVRGKLVFRTFFINILKETNTPN